MQISKRTKGKKKHVISIPKEIVIEILRRVPCHELSEKLKKVCMQWCSIIYSGSFAYSHIERRILKSSSFSELEMVIISAVGDDQCSVTVSSLEWHNNYQNNQFQDWETKDLYTAKDVLGQTLLPDRYMMRVNSVNGFICFYDDLDARFHVCNPITKEYVTTPTNTYLGIRDAPAAMGFGFSQLSFEYKVVVLDYITNLYETRPSVFTIGIDHSWRSLKHIPHKLYSDVITVAHVKGVLYWYSETYASADRYLVVKSKTKTLVRFDVTKEEFDMMVVPIESLGEYVGIADKGGRQLCLTNISYGPICSLMIEVYVVDNLDHDLSSLNSWRKEFTVIAPSIAYGIALHHVYTIIVTDEILVIQLSDKFTEDGGFFDVATGQLLALFSVPQYATTVHYVPSLVALGHRPLLATSSS